MRAWWWIAAVLACAAPVQAQVFKCQQGGRTVYSDVPCQGVRAVLDREQLQGNTVRREPEHHLPGQPPQAGEAAPPVIPGQPAAPVAAGQRAPACPDEQDIRNLETKLSSISFDDPRSHRERNFLQQELRRARACRVEGGSYTREDWRRIQQAIDAQGNLRPEDRQRERGIARGIHEPNASEQEKQRMQQARERAARSAAHPPHGVITSCDPGGCWDNHGRRYHGSGGIGSTVIRSDGRPCVRTGPDSLQCN